MTKEELEGKKYQELKKIADEMGLKFDKNPNQEELKEAILTGKAPAVKPSNEMYGADYLFKKTDEKQYNAINVGKDNFDKYLKNQNNEVFVEQKDVPEDAEII